MWPGSETSVRTQGKGTPGELAAGDDRRADPACWQLRLLGAVGARRGNLEILHWPLRAEVLLLARLALAPDRAHPREELIELLWPATALDVGRNRLRQVLSTLRQKLEPTGLPPVIAADRQCVRLLPGTLSCDAVRFQELLREGASAAARAAYGGELLPGFYDEWVLEARRALAADWERLESAQAAAPAAPALLPAAWTRSFGLAPSLTQVSALVRDQRLVTVIAPGGAGKTRLAAEVAHSFDPARTARPAFERVAFVPLADCRDATDIQQALAHALRLVGTKPLEEALLLLRQAHGLLVLDNAEQVIEPLRGLVQTLLQGAPGLHLLLTSRRRLHLSGEQLFTLAGLPTPAASTPAAQLRENPAVALFIDRAQGVQPDFATDEAPLPAVGALVRHLQGSPLALELAASRMGSMSPAELLELLQADDPTQMHHSHLELLRLDGAAEPRHASMEAVIAWSWQLLDAPQQRLLAAVGLVAGETDLELLADVLQVPPLRVMRMADEAVGQSMLQRVGQREHARYMMAAALREFIHERWPADDGHGLRVAWVQALTRRATAIGGTGAGMQLKALLPASLALLTLPALQREAPAALLDLVLALRPHWESACMPLKLLEGVEGLLSDHARAIAPERASVAFELLAYLRFASGCAGQAHAHAQAALRLADNDPALRARALVRRCWVTLARRRAEEAGTQSTGEAPRLALIRQALQEALALAQAVGDRETEARALHQWGILSGQFEGDWVAAEAAFARAQTLWEERGDTRNAMARLRSRAQCWTHLGRFDEAHAALAQALQAARADDDPLGCIDGLQSLSALWTSQGRWEAALATSQECVALCWQQQHRHGLAYALWSPALPLAQLGQPEIALQLAAFAAVFWQDTCGPLSPADRLALRRTQALARLQIGAARAAQCRAEGQALRIEQAIEMLAQASPRTSTGP